MFEMSNRGVPSDTRFYNLIQRLADAIERDPNVTTSDGRIDLRSLIHPAGIHESNDTLESFLQSHFRSPKSAGQVVVFCLAYLIVFALSLFVNSLVCCAIYRTRRLHTVTNLFIVNLAISDLFMTIFNLPFNMMRHVIDEWFLGQFMCGLVIFTQTVFVYVSTFTMTAIAVDRYIVLVHPFWARMSIPTGLLVVLVIWLLAGLMSLPLAIFAKVGKVEMFLYSAYRCRVVYPEPSDSIEKLFTLATFIGQYVLPMSITTVAYLRISRRLWKRQPFDLGLPPPPPSPPPPHHHQQQHHHHQQHPNPIPRPPMITIQRLQFERNKRRTISMLLVVVILFNVSWLPLNLYHILTDFHPNNFYHDSTTYLCLHWLAVSSVCCNPFVYCWLNDAFRDNICRRTRRSNNPQGTRSRRRHVDRQMAFARPLMAPGVRANEEGALKRLQYDRFGDTRMTGSNPGDEGPHTEHHGLTTGSSSNNTAGGGAGDGSSSRQRTMEVSSVCLHMSTLPSLEIQPDVNPDVSASDQL